MNLNAKRAQWGWGWSIDDTVEFFNLLLETRLTSAEKTDLVAFLRVR